MTKQKFKGLISLLVSLAMVCSISASPAFADEDGISAALNATFALPTADGDTDEAETETETEVEAEAEAETETEAEAAVEAEAEATAEAEEATEAPAEATAKAESAAAAIKLSVMDTSDEVAQIGSTTYATLAAAVSAAEDDDTITLLADTELTANLVISVSLTLDLNGKTITTGSYYIQQKTSNTDLTVKDGTITGSASYILYKIYAGKMTLTNVDVINSKTTNNAYALYVVSQSGIVNFTATGCTFTSGKVGAYISGTTSTTEGSEFSFDNCTMSGGSYGLNINGTGSLNTVTVDGCTISGTASGSSAFNVAGNAAGVVTVTDTAIKAYSGATAVFIAYNAGAVTVELGEDNVVTGAVKLGNQQSATSVSYTLKVTGGCFDYGDEIPFVDPVEANDIGITDMATITGGYYKVDVSSVLPTGYECSENSEKDGYTWKVTAVSDATYYTVDEDGNTYYHDTLADAIAANSGTIYVRKSVELDDLVSTLASSDAVLSTDTGVTLTYSGTLSELLSAMGTTASLSGATVVCSDITLSSVSTSGGKLTGGSGFVKSDCANYGELLASNYLFQVDTYDITSADNFAAKNGYIGYLTLQKAVDSVYNYSGSTITLLKDVTESVMLVSPSVTFTLDLGGFTLTAADGYGYGFAISYTTAADGSIFSKAENSNVTIKNGTIVGNGSDYGVTTNGILTNVALTLDNVNITTGETAGIAVYLPAGGSTTISGCTITGGTGVQLCGGSLTINDSETNTTTITATGEDTTATKTGDGGICDGAAVSIIERDGYQDITSVSISGGTYTAANSDAVVAYNWSSNASSAWDSTCTISISSGTYSSDVNAYTTDTTAAVSNGDGTYTVQTVNTDTVALLYDADGEYTEYSDLAKAFTAAGDGYTVQLIKDVMITGATYNGDGLYQVSGKEVTFDLNGYTLSVDTTRILGVKNGGTLNVENGTIAIADNTESTYKQFNMVRGSSAFNATNVTFDANLIGSYAVYIASDSTTDANVALTDCTFTDVTNAIVFDAGNNSTVTLTGCKYAKQPFSTSNFTTVDNYTVVVTDNSDFTYEANNSYALFFNYVVEDGGTIDTTSTVTVKNYYGDASLTVNDGGTITANVRVNDGTTMTVNGGTVTGTITVIAEGATEENAILTASAEEYDITGGLLTINGGTITGQVKSSGTLIMTDGTVRDNGTGLSDGVIYITGGNVYVEGGTVIGTTRGFGFAGSGTINGTISGGSITGSDIALMVRPNETNYVTLSGGSYTATNALYLANGDSTIFADGYSAYNTAGTAVTSTLSGSVTLYKSALDDKTVVVAVEDAAATVTSSDGTVTRYTSLADAVAAANAATEAVTITLLSDVAVDEGQIVFDNSNAEITLELNGKTISRGESTYDALTVVQSGTTLNVQDSSEAATGGIDATFTNSTSTTSYAIWNEGTLNIISGTIAGRRAIYGTTGTVNISGGTISGAYIGVMASGSMNVNISGGTITGSSHSGVYMSSTGTLNITGGTISSKYSVNVLAGTAIIDGENVSIGGTYGVYCTGASTTANIKSGTINATYGATAFAGANVTIGETGTDGPTITGTYEALEVSTSASATASSVMTVYSGTLSGTSYGICIYGKNSAYYSQLYVYGGTISATNYFGITGNGSTGQGYTKIYIYGGEITSTNGQAIYHPQQNGTMYVYGGTIKGDTGIEVRDGTVVIEDKTEDSSLTIEATGTPTTSDPNYSGSTTSGAAVAVAPYNLSDISVSISSGTLTGVTAVTVVNPNSVEEWNYTTTVAISGGTFNGAVTEYIEDTLQISGGDYSSVVDAEYCADGYAPVTTVNDKGYYGVTQFYIGISTNSTTEEIPASIASGYGESTMYVKVSADYISNYTETAYPTTSLTYTPDSSVDSGSYIFAGWYTLDEDGSYTAMNVFPKSEEDETGATAYYAKFVDKNALKVYCVYTPKNATTSGPANNAWRFISSLESGKPQALLFKIGDIVYTAKTFYTSSRVGSVNKTYSPTTDFSSASKYVASCSVLDNTDALTSYTVQSGWLTLDGTEVYGDAYTFDASSCTAATALDGTVQQ